MGSRIFLMARRTSAIQICKAYGKPRFSFIRVKVVRSFSSNLWHDINRWSFKFLHPNKFSTVQNNRIHFDRHRCIFIHVPKCAGTSVERSLFGNNFNEGHPNLKRYQVIFNRNEFKTYFKFTVVRNPYDRLVSAFLFLKNGGMNPNDKNWAEKYLSPYDNFETFVRKWVNRKNIRSATHFHPQCDFICLKKGQVGVDFIGFYENLESDFQFICRQLQVDSTLLSVNRNSARSSDCWEYYTDETRAIVADVYGDDFRVLGY